MPTLSFKDHPKSRTEAGSALLGASKSTNVTPVKKPLATFLAAHRAYVAADTRSQAARAKVQAAEVKVGGLDADQDAAVELLASALIGAGEDRKNPFARFGAQAPAALARLPHATEVAAIHKLVAAVRKAKLGSTPVEAACKRAEAAAKAVQSALDAIAPLAAKDREARAERDALGQPWETAFARLKRAAQVADDEHGTEIYAALFERTAPAKKAKKAAKKTPAPTPPAKSAAVAAP